MEKCRSKMNGVSKTKSFLLALIIIIGLVFFNLPNIANQIKDFFYSLSSPIQKKVDSFSKQITASWNFLNELKEISRENIELKKEIQQLIARNAELKELEKENQFLRSSLSLANRWKHQLELADVVGRDFQGLEKYVLVNKGKSAGIKKNMPVIVSKNILIGKIIEASDDFSKVLLITSFNNKVPALVQESRIGGLVKGIKENLLFMDLVPKDAKVEKDQSVITSGVSEIFPKGLLIGKIVLVESSENEIFQRIEVKPMVEMEKLEQIFIIKSY